MNSVGAATPASTSATRRASRAWVAVEYTSDVLGAVDTNGRQ
jgi:hypothetical protein